MPRFEITYTETSTIEIEADSENAARGAWINNQWRDEDCDIQESRIDHVRRVKESL
jgi:hypothetical protein